MAKRPTLTDTQKQKKKNGICITLFCTKKAQKDKKGLICTGCERERYKARHPLRYAYTVLKNNAKRRRKLFTLTFDYFKNLAEKNDYLRKKGRGSKSLQIDRINESGGYTDDNVQTITLRENVYKYAKHKRDNSEVPF